MSVILVILATLYVIGVFVTFGIGLIEWFEVKEYRSRLDAELRKDAARMVFAAPVWPFYFLGKVLAEIPKMREALWETEETP